MIAAGRLNTPITIQRLSPGVDALGQPLAVWTDYAMVWANVKHLSGAEAIKADTITSTVKASIRVRWLAGVNAGMRVNASGVLYQILAVMPDIGRREFVDLACEVIA